MREIRHNLRLQYSLRRQTLIRESNNIRAIIKSNYNCDILNAPGPSVNECYNFSSNVSSNNDTLYT